MIFATFSIVYLVRRRVFARILLSVFWLALGVCNGYMLLKRVTPFNAQDLKAWSEGLAVSKNYFSAMEFVLLGVGIVAVILWVISSIVSLLYPEGSEIPVLKTLAAKQYGNP